MELRVEDVVALCERKRVGVGVVNLSVGTMMIDQTGVVGRGSAATALANGVTPPIQTDEAILAAAATFVLHHANGEKSLLDRAEFEKLLGAD